MPCPPVVAAHGYSAKIAAPKNVNKIIKINTARAVAYRPKQCSYYFFHKQDLFRKLKKAAAVCR